MRKITWLISDEETAVMDLSPVAAKAHKLRVQKAAFGGFELPKVDEEISKLRGRVKLGKVAQSDRAASEEFTS